MSLKPTYLKIFYGMLIMACSFTQVLAQEISGSVHDDSGEKLIGATISIKNTNKGVVTDKNGKFTITVEELPATLVARFSGFVEEEVTVSSAEEPISFVLIPDVEVLSDVIVTARRVNESLQKVPVAVTAFKPEDLVARGAFQINELAQFTPNLTIDNAPAVSGAGFGTTIFIRGIGQNDFIGTTDPGVGMYLDGVYIARTIGTLFETEGAQVEILRGPQGTTFGRNTVGGAINITTPLPTNDKFYGTAEASFGNYGFMQLRSSNNIPISAKTAANLSFVYRKRNGYSERIIAGDELGDDNTLFLRGKLSSLPSDKLELDMSFDYTHTRASSAVSTLLEVNPAAFPFGVLYNQLVGNAVDPSWITNDPFKSNGTGDNFNNLDVIGLSGTAGYDISDGVKTKLILGYRNLDSEFSRDGDNTPFTYRETANTFTSEQLSTELQFFNNKPTKLNWLVGLYYMKETIVDHAKVDLGTGLYDALEAADPDDVADPFGGPGNPANIGLDLELSVKNDIEIANLAAFFNGSYNFTDKLSLSGGIRASKDTKRYEAEHEKLNSGAFVVPPGTVVEDDWTSVTGRLGLEYKFTNKIMSYISVANGFKSGGFNARPLRSEDGILPFDPEEVLTYELGFKSDLGSKSRLNISLFKSDYENIQVTFVNTPEIVVENAAEAEIKGIETEFFTTPTKGVTFNFALGYTDAAYTKVDPLANEITTDSYFIKTPKYQVAFGLGLTPKLSDKIGLSVRFDYSYKDDVYHDPANTPALMQPGYGLLSSRIGLIFNNKYEVAIFGKNLTDEAYLVSGLTSASFGVTEGSYGAPRLIGGSFRIKF